MGFDAVALVRCYEPAAGMPPERGEAPGS